MARKKPTTQPDSPWPFRIAAAGVFLAQVAFLRGATDPFRIPKDAVILGAICLAVGLAVAAAANRKSLSYPRSVLMAVLFALPMLQAVSALWSASPTRALESAISTLIWVIAICWLATLDSASRFRLALVAAIGVVFSAAVMVLQIAGVQVFDLSELASGRLKLTGLSGNPADLAMAAVLLLPLLLAKRNNSPLSRAQVGLVLVLSLATLLTRTLSGIGALSVVFLVWLIQQRSRVAWMRVAIGGLLMLAVALGAGLGARLVRSYEQIQKGNWYFLLSAREDGWSAASQMVTARPISGVGAANYDYLYYPSRLKWFERKGGVGRRGELATHFNWAHSDPLQLAAELGVIGLLWMVALLVALVSARKRAGPVFTLALAAYAPFALLHYPTHLAVALIPITLALGEIIATTGQIDQMSWGRARVPIAGVVMIVAIIGAGWQLRRVAADLWMGSLEMVLAVSQQAAPEARVRSAAAVEASILARIDRMPRRAPVLWRTVGRARMVRRDYRQAEAAFRSAYDGWPHEDADFYLGLALVAQGRRSEGLQHLGRVCRTNPRLVRAISDPDLRRSVKDMVDTYRGR